MINRHEPIDNSQEVRLLFIIYSLEEYEKKLGERELTTLLEKCPSVQAKEREKEENEKNDFTQKKDKEKKDTSQLLFMEWLISLEHQYLDKVLQEILWKMSSQEMLEENFSREISRDRFEKYMRHMIALLCQENGKKAQLLEQYKKFISHLLAQATQNLNSLIRIRNSMIAIFTEQERQIQAIRQNALSAIIALYAGLPVTTNSEFENLRREVIEKAKEFFQNPEIPVEKFFEYLSTPKEKISQYISDPANHCSPELLSKFHSAHEDTKESLALRAVMQEEHRELEKNIRNIDGEINQVQRFTEALQKERAKPSYSKNIIDDYNKRQETQANLTTLFDQLVQNAKIKIDLQSKTEIGLIDDMGNQFAAKIATKSEKDIRSDQINSTSLILEDDEPDENKIDNAVAPKPSQ